MQAAVVRPRPRPGRSLRSTARGRDVDWVLLGASLALACFGLVVICSATGGPGAAAPVVARQGLFLVAGTTAMAVLSRMDYRRIRPFVLTLYLSCIVVLLAVLSPLGSEVNGTQGWFRVAGFSLQPAEFAKVVLIVALAALFSGRGGLGPRGRLAVALGGVGIVSVLVLAQGEFGSVLVYAAITAGVVVAAGVPRRYLVGLVATGALAAGFLLSSGVLHGYQQDRLTTFLDPEHDVRGSSYNQRQSMAAVGSGGLFGKGLFDGPQTQLRFVPEQETDFIFTVVGEELGFAGGALLLGLYGVVVVRVHALARAARDDFGGLLCVGVLVMLVFQVFQNVGMNLGILPVAGIPLPLLSYGGSSLLTVMICIGLLLSVSAQRTRGSPF